VWAASLEVVHPGPCGMWECWLTLDRAIDASRPVVGRGEKRWFETGNIAWPFSSPEVRGPGGRRVPSFCDVCPAGAKDMWVACRWVKPECKCSELENRLDLVTRPARASSVFWQSSPWGCGVSCYWEARSALEICGTGGYGVVLSLA